MSLLPLLFVGVLDHVPLVMPRFPEDRSLVVEPHAQARAAMTTKRYYVAAKLAGTVQSGVLRGGTLFSAEVGVRLPMLMQRIGLSLDIGIGGLWPSGVSGFGTWFSTAVLATYSHPLPKGTLRGSLGPALDWMSNNIIVNDTRFSDRFLTFGASASAAYLYPLGPGSLLGEVRYRVLTYVAMATPTISHGVSFAAGYAYDFL